MKTSANISERTNAAEIRLVARRRDTKLMLWGIVALGALLRLRALSAKSFWLDEIASVVIARMPDGFFWHWLWTQEGNMALYYVMLRPWLGIHMGEGTVRLLSALPGIVSLPVMYLLGKQLFGRGAGLLASLFLALSTCAVVYSQEARAYSWLLLGVIVSTYLFVRLIEQPTYAMAGAYGLAAGITLYFHYFGLLVPLAHAVSLAALPAFRRPRKQLLAAGAIILVLALPVLWMIHIQPVRHLDWVSKPSLLELYHLGVFLAAESGKGAGPALLAIELILLVVFFRAMAAHRRMGESERELFPYALVASGILTPIMFSLLVSIVRPVFFHRFLIICLPAWLLAIAAAICALSRRRIAMLAVAGVCTLSLVSTVMSYSRMREDWRGAVNFLIDNARSQDVVLYYQSVGGWAAENYRDWLPGGGANRPMAASIEPQSSDWRAKIAGAGRIWLVEYPANPNDETSRAVEAELHSRYTAAAERQYRAVTVTEFVAK
jgi:uncharacterized membrane protein